MAISRPIGGLAALAGVAILAFLIAGANGYGRTAEQFVIEAGIPITLLCGLAGTTLAVVGTVMALRRRRRG